jgi:hypothetical protein
MESLSIENIKDILTIVAIIVAAIWTYYRFGITRERHPKLQFDLDLNIIGKTDTHYIIQLVAIVENKGLTRQYIKDFKFHILYYNHNMPINCDDESINKQLKFEYELKNRDWLDAELPPFVDGGMTHKFRYITVLPIATEYVMIYSKFMDPKKTLFKRKPDLYHISSTFNLKSLDRISE